MAENSEQTVNSIINILTQFNDQGLKQAEVALKQVATQADVTATEVQQLNQNTQQYDKTMVQATSSAGGFASALKNIATIAVGMTAGNAITGMVQQYAQLFAMKNDAMQMAASLETLQRSVHTMAGKIGTDMVDLRKQIDGMTGALSGGVGGVTSQQAWRSALMFMEMNLPTKKLNELTTAAKNMGFIFDEITSDTLDRFISAIVTGNTVLLKQVGIQTSYTDIMEEQARLSGKKASAMTVEQQQEAMLDFIIRKSAIFTGQYDAAMETTGKRMGSLSRIAEEAQISFGKTLQPFLDLNVNEQITFWTTVGKFFKENYAPIRAFSEITTGKISELQKDTGSLVSQVFSGLGGGDIFKKGVDIAAQLANGLEEGSRAVFDKAAEIMSKVGEWLKAKDAIAWGSKLIMDFASGITTGAVYVVQALNGITGAIVDMLKVGSPARSGLFSLQDNVPENMGKKFISNFSKGVTAGTSIVESAFDKIAQVAIDYLRVGSATNAGPGSEQRNIPEVMGENFDKSYVEGLLTGIPQVEGAIEKIAGAVTEGIQSLGDGGLIKDLGDAGSKLTGAFADGASKGYEDVKDTFDSIIDLSTIATSLTDTTQPAGGEWGGLTSSDPSGMKAFITTGQKLTKPEDISSYSRTMTRGMSLAMAKKQEEISKIQFDKNTGRLTEGGPIPTNQEMETLSARTLTATAKAWEEMNKTGKISLDVGKELSALYGVDMKESFEGLLRVETNYNKISIENTKKQEDRVNLIKRLAAVLKDSEATVSPTDLRKWKDLLPEAQEMLSQPNQRAKEDYLTRLYNQEPIDRRKDDARLRAAGNELNLYQQGYQFKIDMENQKKQLDALRKAIAEATALGVANGIKQAMDGEAYKVPVEQEEAVKAFKDKMLDILQPLQDAWDRFRDTVVEVINLIKGFTGLGTEPVVLTELASPKWGNVGGRQDVNETPEQFDARVKDFEKRRRTTLIALEAYKKGQGAIADFNNNEDVKKIKARWGEMGPQLQNDVSTLFTAIGDINWGNVGDAAKELSDLVHNLGEFLKAHPNLAKILSLIVAWQLASKVSGGKIPGITETPLPIVAMAGTAAVTGGNAPLTAIVGAFTALGPTIAKAGASILFVTVALKAMNAIFSEMGVRIAASSPAMKGIGEFVKNIMPMMFGEGGMWGRTVGGKILQHTSRAGAVAGLTSMTGLGIPLPLSMLFSFLGLPWAKSGIKGTSGLKGAGEALTKLMAWVAAVPFGSVEIPVIGGSGPEAVGKGLKEGALGKVGWKDMPGGAKVGALVKGLVNLPFRAVGGAWSLLFADVKYGEDTGLIKNLADATKKYEKLSIADKKALTFLETVSKNAGKPLEEAATWSKLEGGGPRKAIQAALKTRDEFKTASKLMTEAADALSESFGKNITSGGIIARTLPTGIKGALKKIPVIGIILDAVFASVSLETADKSTPEMKQKAERMFGQNFWISIIGAIIGAIVAGVPTGGAGIGAGAVAGYTVGSIVGGILDAIGLDLIGAIDGRMKEAGVHFRTRALPSFIDNIKDAIAKAPEALGEQFNLMGLLLGNLSGGNLSEASSNLGTLMGPLATSVIGILWKALGDAAGAIGTTMGDMGGIIGEFLTESFKNTVAVGAGLLEIFEAIFSEAVTHIPAILGNLTGIAITALVNFWTMVWHGLEATAGGAVNLVNWLRGIIGIAFEQLGQSVDAYYVLLGDLLFKRGDEKLGDSVLTWAQALATNIWNALSDELGKQDWGAIGTWIVTHSFFAPIGAAQDGIKALGTIVGDDFIDALAASIKEGVVEIKYAVKSVMYEMVKAANDATRGTIFAGLPGATEQRDEWLKNNVPEKPAGLLAREDKAETERLAKGRETPFTPVKMDEETETEFENRKAAAAIASTAAAKKKAPSFVQRVLSAWGVGDKEKEEKMKVIESVGAPVIDLWAGRLTELEAVSGIAINDTEIMPKEGETAGDYEDRMKGIQERVRSQWVSRMNSDVGQSVSQGIGYTNQERERQSQAGLTIEREYPEQREDGSVYVVTQWSDGTYTEVLYKKGLGKKLGGVGAKQTGTGTTGETGPTSFAMAPMTMEDVWAATDTSVNEGDTEYSKRLSAAQAPGSPWEKMIPDEIGVLDADSKRAWVAQQIANQRKEQGDTADADAKQKALDEANALGGDITKEAVAGALAGLSVDENPEFATLTSRFVDAVKNGGDWQTPLLKLGEDWVAEIVKGMKAATDALKGEKKDTTTTGGIDTNGDGIIDSADDNVTGRQFGGIVLGPTLTWLGEHGVPEIVMNANKYMRERETRTGPMIGSVNINATDPMTAQAEERRLAKILAEEMGLDAHLRIISGQYGGIERDAT